MNSKEIQNLQEAYLGVYTEDRAPGVKPYKPGPTGAEVRADAAAAAKKKAASGAGKAGYGPEEKFKSDWKLGATPSTTSTRKDGTEETVSQRMDRESPYATRPFSPLFQKQGSRTASAVTRATEGPGEPQSVTMPRMKSKPSREIIRRGQNESYDLYDIILSHLLDEGYAETAENATAIMANMSEDWRESIVEAMIVRTGTSTNAAGQNIPWTHSHNTATGKSTVKDKFGRRDATGTSAKMDTTPSAKIKPKMDKNQRYKN